MSHPTADQLLEAVQLFLKEAEGALPGRLAFHAKVAGNALAIVRRELAQLPDEAEAAALAAFGGAEAIAAVLEQGRVSPDDPGLLAAVRKAALARLAVDNPRYPTYRRLADKESRMRFPPANYHADIDPTGARIKALRDDGPDGPIVMLNLLKFKAVADYPVGHPDTGSSGEEAYGRYEKLFIETVGAISMAEPIYDGPVMRTIVGTEADGDWDRMLIVRYPSRHHFLAMMADETYRAGLVHRYAALERTILIQCGAG